jgi:O-antigen ligase
VIVEPILFYALLRTAHAPRATARGALDALAAGGALAALWALAGMALFGAGDSGAAVAAEGVIRANGPYPSPNNLALFLGRLVPFLAAGVLWSASPQRRWAYGSAALVVLMALLATFSRGAWLLGLPIVGVYLAIVALARARTEPIDRGPMVRRAAALLAGIGGLLATVALVFGRTERVVETFVIRPGSTGFTRLRLWESAWAMVRDHPWRGVGLDNFLYLYRERYVQRIVAQERDLNHPHNVLLDWWTRLGLVGVLLLVTLAYASLRAGVQALAIRHARPAVAAGALGMQLYALAHGLVDNSFFLVDLALAWWIAQAALLAEAAAPGPEE